MKNSYLNKFLMLTAVFSVYTGVSQDCRTMFDDFENTRLFSGYDSVDGQIDSIHVNPKPNRINSSATCLKYTRGTGNLYDAFVVSTDLITNGDLLKGNLVTFEVDVLSPITGSLTLTLRSDGSLDYPSGRFNQLRGNIAVANQWTTVRFTGDIYHQPDESVYADSIREIEIQPLAGQTIAHEIYFDNIRMLGVQMIDNFDSERNNQIASHDGTFVEDVDNDSYNLLNFSSRYGTFKKGLFQANSGVIYELGDVSANDLMTERSKFLISSVSHSWGMGISVYLINKATYATSGAGIHSKYNGVAATQNSWNYVTFDLDEVTDESVIVDGILLLFEPGAVSSNTYEFDNFGVIYPSPDAPVILGSETPCIGENTYTYSVYGYENAAYNWTVTSEGEIIGDALGSSVELKFLDPLSNGSVIIETSVTENGKCSSALSSKEIDFSMLPASVNAGGDISLCEGEVVSLSGSFSGANSVVWSTIYGNGDFTKGPEAPLSAFAMNEEDVEFGFIDFTLTAVGGNCGDASDDLVVTIDALAKVFLEDEYKLCPGIDTVSITPTANVGGDIQYWGGAGGEINKPSPLTPGEEVVFTIPTWIQEGGFTRITFNAGQGYTCGAVNHQVKFTKVAQSDEACLVTSLLDGDISEQSVLPTLSEDGVFKVLDFNSGDVIHVVDAIGNSEQYVESEFFTNMKGQLIIKHVRGDDVSVTKVLRK